MPYSIWPLEFLLIVLAVTLAAVIAQGIARWLHQRRLRGLANEFQLHYSPRDRFKLAAKVAEEFPIPGAAQMRVRDLIYGIRGAEYRYVFTADYTVGVVRTKHRRRSVLTFSEPRHGPHIRPLHIELAANGRPILEQYRQLVAEGAAEIPGDSAGNPEPPGFSNDNAKLSAKAAPFS